ncbi:hypothetical protein [Sphingosinithalassobacter sp. CS137]|uniref:hypothetical protein n=1 Tax=Sphingosinithalassobacter sp. CS137 TaxID=2762748 RepID=UPI00165D8EFB|nr:hypothetical protein [Sphingosinithalassobacter sp. CS137]
MLQADAATAPARLIAGGATILGASVLADSSIEHYRGSFHHPAMAVPIVAAVAAIRVNAAGGRDRSSVPNEPLRDPAQRPERRPRTPAHAAIAAAGAAGLGFHGWDIARRVGHLRWSTLFYAAPIGAPAALILSGALGAAADALATRDPRLGPLPVGGRFVGALAVIGLVGTSAEAALLHFRGAFHSPWMWLPVTLPPLAALALARDTLSGVPKDTSWALLGATALLGFVGAGFHARGVARNMGGWRNWRQNLLVGPPIPAPPAFTGLALAGLGALLLMRRGHG